MLGPSQRLELMSHPMNKASYSILLSIPAVFAASLTTHNSRHANALPGPSQSMVATDSDAVRSPTFSVLSSMAHDPNNGGNPNVLLCDGIADDVEIQTAINAIAPTGGTVKLSEGSFFLFDQTILVPDNVELVGAGSDRTLLFRTVAGDPIQLIRLLNTNHAALRGFSIDEAAKKEPTGADVAVDITSSSDIDIQDISIVNTTRLGIAVAGSRDVRIRNCSITDAGQESTLPTGMGIWVGIRQGVNSERILITGCRTDNNKLNGIYLSDCSRVSITDSSFEGNSTMMDGGQIDCFNTSHHITIRGCHFKGGLLGSHLELHGQHITAMGNTFEKVARFAIASKNGGTIVDRYHTIVGNTILNPSAGPGVAAPGIIVEPNIRHVTISNNTIVAGAASLMTHGIHVHAGCDHYYVGGNLIDAPVTIPVQHPNRTTMGTPSGMPVGTDLGPTYSVIGNH